MNKISRTFIERFNRAAELAREGKIEEALEAYENIKAPFDDPKEERIMTGEFLGMVELRKAYCLMDLERFEEAREIFASNIIQAALGQFDFTTLCDYFYSYGNTLGKLGLLEKMDEVMKNVLKIAVNELNDLKRCEDTWYWIMYWAKEHEAWEYLEKQCISAHKFGVKSGSLFLQIKAGEFGCYAYRGLGKIEEARRGARIIIKRYKDAKINGSVLKEWEDFLKSLD
ncbi:MAG TPA: hypothetical protein ENI34_05960 [candidate division WOR-3 bacterium]|uniref:Tetratricopeptide repeat protein n=1 Tax=candidate division WOR-3 bacterium TaxID=2052148 RepID=A0A9C9K0B0_UNCW3|nr:hypothetical protein [candidate division WOR-3 bacterium]